MTTASTMIHRGAGRWSAVVAALLISALSATSVLAQMQVQQQGNALDANPMVNSGGSNTPIQGYVPINGNNIITGNVSGLKYFHAPVGTTSTYEFQGNLGSATLNSFARTSAGGLQTTPVSANQAYYLPSTTVSGARGALYSAPNGGGFDSALIPSGAISATSPQSDQLRYPSTVSSGISMRQFSSTPTEGAGAISSPLFGIRPPTEQMSPLSVPPATPPKPASDTQGPMFRAQPDEQLNTNPQNPNPQNTAPQNADNTGSDAAQKMRPQDRAAADRVNGSADPHNQLRVKGQSAESRDANVLPEDQTISNQSRVSDTYRTLLDELRQAEAKAREKNDAMNGKNGAGATKEAPAPIKPPTSGTTGSKGNAGTTDQLSGGLRKPGSDMDLTTKNSGLQSADPAKGGYQPRQNVIARSQLENTPTETLQAGQQIAPLKSLARNAQIGKATPFDQLMEQGEALLKQGKYLEAASAYQRALTAEPNNALAVMGRANAELGAGMYESAAADLKFIFTRKPELISVRYTLGDYIPSSRQEYLIRDLQNLSTSAGPGNTASFLLCYLQYNTGRVESLQAELGRWQNRPWRDSWQPIMQRAWGK